MKEMQHMADFRFESNDDKSVMATATTASGRDILVVTAPASSIDGSEGPVLIASDLMENVIVVYSDEYIDSLIPTSPDEVALSIAQVTTVINVGIATGMAYLKECN
jgi:hypothetical protein